MRHAARLLPALALLAAACASSPPAPVEAPATEEAPLPPPTLESLLGIRLPPSPTPMQVRGAADSLEQDLHPGEDLRAAVRIALYEYNLRRPGAGPAEQWDLDRVMRLRFAAGDADGAERALAAWGEVVGLQPYQRANYRANIASCRGDMEEYRRLVREMVDEPGCPESERVSGTYWIARTLQRSGDLDGAREVLHGLFERWGGTEDPRARIPLGLARELLLAIERTGR